MKGVSLDNGETKNSKPNTVNKGIFVLDFILRILAFIGTITSAILMATTTQTLPFFTQFFQFRARYNDLPTFTFFVIANAVVSAYLVLTAPISIVHIVRGMAHNSRVVLMILDTAALAFLMGGASAAAAIVYLAHKGNSKTNWLAICQQFNSFCERISGSLVGSFVGVIAFVLLILLSGVALSRR